VGVRAVLMIGAGAIAPHRRLAVASARYSYYTPGLLMSNGICTGLWRRWAAAERHCQCMGFACLGSVCALYGTWLAPTALQMGCIVLCWAASRRARGLSRLAEQGAGMRCTLWCATHASLCRLFGLFG
jgi:hypothetical protein